jgi:hypothetical protein
MPADNKRDQPDISLFASPGFDGSGYIICQQDQTFGIPCSLNLNTADLSFLTIGGTSASAPAFAGIMALVNQYQAAHGGNARQGNANYVLYALAKKPGASCTSMAGEAGTCVFNDVTHGNSAITGSLGTNSVPCQGGTLQCSAKTLSFTGVLVSTAGSDAWNAAAGYDMTTGLGSVNINNLVASWGSVSTVPTTTTLTLAPTTAITHGTAENVSVNIAVTAQSGTAKGDVSLIAKFADGTTQAFNEFTLGANGSFSGKTQSLPGGQSYQVTAHYSGDGTNAPSDSTPVTVTVNPENSQTFIVVPLYDIQTGKLISGNASSVPYGSVYRIRMYVTNSSAVATAGGPPNPICEQVNQLTCPTGSISLTANGTGVDGANGAYPLNNAGYTRDINPTLGGGTYSLLAQYSGDTSYNASNSTADSLTVTKVLTSTTFVYAPSTMIVGIDGGFQTNTTANSLGVAPTGQVNLHLDSTLLTPTSYSSTGQNGTATGQVSLQADNNVTFPVGTVSGQHTITATYVGDGNYASSSTTSMSVNVLNQTRMSLSVDNANIMYGSNVTLTALITTSVKTPAISKGGVSFVSYLGVTLSGTVTYTLLTDSSGNTELQATLVTTPQSTEGISANYIGDANFEPMSSNQVVINVNIPDFTISPEPLNVAAAAGQAASGQVVITPVSQTPSVVTLTLTPPSGISGYTFALSSTQVNLNGAPISATLSMTPMISVPTNAIRAQTRQAGFFAFGRFDWWGLGLVAGLGGIFSLGLPGRRKRWRAALALGAIGLFLLALGCGGGGGSASSGGGGSTGGGGGGVTTPQPTSITLSTNNAKAAEYVPFTITATLTSSKPATGNVTFYNFGTPISGGVIVNNQAQTGPGYITNPGVYQITASYPGDANNAPCTSSSLIQVITGTWPITIQGNTGGDVHSVQANLTVQ